MANAVQDQLEQMRSGYKAEIKELRDELDDLREDFKDRDEQLQKLQVEFDDVYIFSG